MTLHPPKFDPTWRTWGGCGPRAASSSPGSSSVSKIAVGSSCLRSSRRFWAQRGALSCLCCPRVSRPWWNCCAGWLFFLQAYELFTRLDNTLDTMLSMRHLVLSCARLFLFLLLQLVAPPPPLLTRSSASRLLSDFPPLLCLLLPLLSPTPSLFLSSASLCPLLSSPPHNSSSS